MIAFGMGNTLLTFVNKYYEYDGKHGIRDKGLTIGGYKSACLADLVATFILENTTKLFNKTVYDEIYREDGLVIMDGLKSNNDIGEWLARNLPREGKQSHCWLRSTGLYSQYFNWREKENDEVGHHPKAEVVRSSYFPFLDMQMTWLEEGGLQFGIYLKLGQELAEVPKQRQLAPATSLL
jgi:hypothetical protein